MKILVVDDDASMRDLIVLYLESEGYLVEAAGSKAMALNWLRRDRFDLLITDNDMPGIGEGLSLMGELGQLQAKPQVIFMSGRLLGNSTLANLAISMGAQICLPKPFLLAELGEAVHTVIPAEKLTPAEAS